MVSDAGLFGPSSITWQLHADPAMWFAGVRALYLQALHPLATRGAYQHSTFKQDPLERLWRTGDFVGVVTYGTRAQAEQAGARVRAIHHRLRGVCPETGPGALAGLRTTGLRGGEPARRDHRSLPGPPVHRLSGWVLLRRLGPPSAAGSSFGRWVLLRPLGPPAG